MSWLVAKPAPPEEILVFSNPLGWIAVRTVGKIVRQLTFGHRTRDAAVRAITPIAPRLPTTSPENWWQQGLARRLDAYAQGVPMDFCDMALDPGPMTAFQSRVSQLCRGIPYGKTLTYGQLAALAGVPGAARAVGNCMASNPIPLLIPCHRVVRASGGPGSYSAPGGGRVKQRLLMMESGRMTVEN
jgi:methylated-DNA-[protein]-cysteine S-methyltransferase